MDRPAPGPALAPTPSSRFPTPTRAALFALAVLFGMNLLNYIDRYVFAAVAPAIMADLRLKPGEFGVLAAAFMVVYTLVSPLMGWMERHREL